MSNPCSYIDHAPLAPQATHCMRFWSTDYVCCSPSTLLCKYSTFVWQFSFLCSFSVICLRGSACLQPMLCPFCSCLPLSCINTSIWCSVSPPVLQHPSACLSIRPSVCLFSLSVAKCFWAARHALSASCSWFSTADSSTGLISPGRVERQLVPPKCGLSVGRIMLTSPCPLCNHCESIVVQEISGSASNLFFSFFSWLCSCLS